MSEAPSSGSAAARQQACVGMVLGTSSGAGKSWLTTARRRWYARQGLRVAPFKAQNWSNNARVVAFAGDLTPAGEIGSAQYFQATAARATSDVRMNPLLVKPERDTHSPVVLLGQMNRELTSSRWRGGSERVWPCIVPALDALRDSHEVVVIEGAGSPAEIHLMDSEIVNMWVARHANAACLFVTGIDRGGAFAHLHLYGTWALLPEADRALLHGFVLNKFRGDAALLEPSPQMLHGLTGVLTLATLPMWWLRGLPEGDGVFEERSLQPGPVTTRIVVLGFPHISNLDESQPLRNISGVQLLGVRSPVQLAGSRPRDWSILPGSKSTSADLVWLRSQGLDQAVAQHASTR